MAEKSKVPPTYDQYSRPPDPGQDFTGVPSMTKMEFAAECDINVIMDRYTQTGELPAGMVATYGDFATGLQFQQAQELIARADQQFEALDAHVRARFNNDPGAFLDFVHDPENYEEARELGLLDAEARPRSSEPAPSAVPPAAPPAAPAGPQGAGPAPSPAK